MMILTIYVIIVAVMSMATYFVFAWDKHQACFAQHRVPEAVLFLMSALLGATGAISAMLLLRHKTQHRSFCVVVPLLWLVQVALSFAIRFFFMMPD